jgi:hypothetical protein
MHTINGGNITEESIKEMLNREYKIYFKRGDENSPPINIYDRRFSLFKMNELNKGFNI